MMINALGEYLGYAENVLLSQRIAELEKKFASLEAQVKVINQ